MDGVGRQITVAAAFSLSAGSSLLLLSYLIRNKVGAVGFSMKPTATSTQRFISSATEGCSPSVKRPRKQVRFSQVKEEPNKPGKATARRKSNQKRDDQLVVTQWRGERKQRVNLPQNWRSLYNGINRYRSQQATLMMYR